MTSGPAGGRLDNGLQAGAYVPLTDVDAVVGQHLLTALGRARIPAYLDHLSAGGPPPSAEHQGAAASPGPLRRLFVAAEDRGDARTIVASAVRALGSDQPPTLAAPDPLVGVDTDAAFAALIADWHVDTISAIRDAERDLTREDADWRNQLTQWPSSDEPVWLDDEHYVPPPPPPLPRIALPTILALIILVISVVILGLGEELGLPGNLNWVLGVGGVLTGAAILVTRLRDHPDEEDDGSAV
jgi:hypothetical protein